MPQTSAKGNKARPAEPAQQGAGLKMAAHPLLLDTTPAAPQSKKDKYKPMQPKFASIKVSISHLPKRQCTNAQFRPIFEPPLRPLLPLLLQTMTRQVSTHMPLGLPPKIAQEALRAPPRANVTRGSSGSTPWVSTSNKVTRCARMYSWRH